MLGIIGTLLLGILYAIDCGMILMHYGDWETKNEELGITLLIFMFLTHVIGSLIQFYFIYVAYKSYKFMKEVLLCQYDEYRENSGKAWTVY